MLVAREPQQQLLLIPLQPKEGLPPLLPLHCHCTACLGGIGGRIIAHALGKGVLPWICGVCLGLLELVLGVIVGDRCCGSLVLVWAGTGPGLLQQVLLIPC